jgi:hypothetical protein
MKQFKYILVVAAVIAFLILGFYMPDFVFYYRDSAQNTQAVSYGLEQVTLEVSSPLIEKIKILRKGYYTMDIDLNSQTERSEDEVLEIALEVNESFDGFAVPERNDLSWEVTPMLVISNNSAYSFIVWDCYLMNENGFMVAQIDDATGKMLSYGITIETSDNSSASYEEVDYDSDIAILVKSETGMLDAERVKILCERLEKYYGLDVSARTDSNAVGDQYGIDDAIIITLMDEDDESVDVLYWESGSGYYEWNEM